MTIDTQRVEELIRQRLESLKQTISANIDSAGQRATGRTQRSMQVDTHSEGAVVVGKLTGRAFFSTLETGTKPWQNKYYRQTKKGKQLSAPRFFVDIIRDWVAAKGLSLNPWAVATKIMAEGSKLYRDGGRTDIYSEAIADAITDIQVAIVSELGNGMALDIVQTLERKE